MGRDDVHSVSPRIAVPEPPDVDVFHSRRPTFKKLQHLANGTVAEGAMRYATRYLHTRIGFGLRATVR